MNIIEKCNSLLKPLLGKKKLFFFRFQNFIFSYLKSLSIQFSDHAKQQILQILEKISLLKPPERLLLYLRMPGGTPETGKCEIIAFFFSLPD